MHIKTKKNNIIPFPVERIRSGKKMPIGLEHDVSTEDEWLEVEDELWAKEDFEGLVQLHKNQLEQHPEDQFAIFSLGQAYFFNYEHEKALETLHQLHVKIPEDPDVLYFILEVLIASGKNENDFEWVVRPDILKLSQEVVDICYTLLKPGHKSCSAVDLFKLFYEKSYLMFTEEQLLAAIIADGRFVVKNPDSTYQAEIKVAR